MILAHEFDEARHLYTSPGRYVLSTSDIIDLVGLSNLEQVPIAVLRNAAYRGKCLHTAVEQYEQGQDWQDDFPADFMDYLDGWFAFRELHNIQIVGAQEVPYVYLHEGTEQAVGATIDLRFLYGGDLYIADLKSIHPLSGKALTTKKLCWRLQTESYKTATEMDEEFVKPLKFKAMHRAVVHIHPKLKGGFAFHQFKGDDSLLWDGAVRMAMEKVSCGITPNRRNCDTLQDNLRASLEAQ
jgi:hypothetical protein